MKNNELARSLVKEEDREEHRKQRNRAKRYRQGRMTIRTLLGKPPKADT